MLQGVKNYVSVGKEINKEKSVNFVRVGDKKILRPGISLGGQIPIHLGFKNYLKFGKNLLLFSALLFALPYIHSHQWNMQNNRPPRFISPDLPVPAQPLCSPSSLQETNNLCFRTIYGVFWFSFSSLTKAPGVIIGLLVVTCGQERNSRQNYSLEVLIIHGHYLFQQKYYTKGQNNIQWYAIFNKEIIIFFRRRPINKLFICLLNNASYSYFHFTSTMV